MTEELLEFAQGPLFRFTFILMLAGLGRRLFLLFWSSAGALARAHNRDLRWKTIGSNILEWLFPFSHFGKSRTVFSVLSYGFHVGVILVPIFLAEHIALWRQGIHLGWPALPGFLADVLTWTTILGGIGLLISRAVYPPTRLFSSTMDYLIPVLVLIPFVTGFVAPRSWNPLSYELMLLLHILSAELLFVLIPFTKLAHCFLFPFTRVAGRIGSRFSIEVPVTYPHSAEESKL